MVDIGPITPRNILMFVSYRLPNLFARRPEMIRPLPEEIGQIEEGIGRAKPSESFVRNFVRLFEKWKALSDG